MAEAINTVRSAGRRPPEQIVVQKSMTTEGEPIKMIPLFLKRAVLAYRVLESREKARCVIFQKRTSPESQHDFNNSACHPHNLSLTSPASSQPLPTYSDATSFLDQDVPNTRCFVFGVLPSIPTHGHHSMRRRTFSLFYFHNRV